MSNWMIKVKGSGILSCLLLFSLDSLYSQSTSDHNFTFDSQFITSVKAYATMGFTINPQTEINHLKKGIPPGVTLSLGFRKLLARDFYIAVGAGCASYPFSVRYRFDPPENSLYKKELPEFSQELSSNWIQYTNFTWRFSGGFLKVFNTEKKWDYTLEATLALEQMVAYPYEVSVTDSYQFESNPNAILFRQRLESEDQNLYAIPF